jgi:probable HAF family extracellular repeat protein
MTMFRARLFFGLMAVLSTIAAAQTTHAFVWTQATGMQDIGTLPGWEDSYGFAINVKGQVVGYDRNPHGQTTTTSFRWTESAGSQRLLALADSNSVAYGVNAAGQVVGTYQGSTFAYLWSPTAGLQDLGNFGGGLTIAFAINSSGQVVGYSATVGGPTHAFLWTQSGGIQDLGTLPGGTYSVATAMNDFGQIVGYADNSQGVTLAVSWRNGKIRVLGRLGGIGRSANSVATGINKLG